MITIGDLVRYNGVPLIKQYKGMVIAFGTSQQGAGFATILSFGDKGVTHNFLVKDLIKINNNT
jgi:hypothetical protein